MVDSFLTINHQPLTNNVKKKAALYGLVIMAEVEPPVPIPNTEVKPSSANGTVSQGTEE
jgi:hypothetical protein